MSSFEKNREEKLVELRELFTDMLQQRNKIHRLTNTRKTDGAKNYPLTLGYSTKTRRPLRDLIKWMDTVDAILGHMLDDLEERHQE